MPWRRAGRKDHDIQQRENPDPHVARQMDLTVGSGMGTVTLRLEAEVGSGVLPHMHR